MELCFGLLKKEQAVDAAKIIVKAFKQPPWNECWEDTQATKSVIASLENPMDRCFAAFDTQKIVGILFGRIQIYSRDDFYIMMLSVLSEYQHKGIGKGLLHFCEKALKSEGISHIELITAPFDKQFYNKCNYSVSDAVHFEKNI
ncbi:GNAT family N-acetyltransferase [Clostridium oryzae]|uniref:Putative acetyltransferase n=1 Tax=Clostridium oryzae TaxID=1450648 RepID=A0A1V4IYY0_9CLOT|nr:GNAT family N-acetyltransferase [Clostridium oryzae]OPJ64607.1 putative acetyltransferase [Clostridium oryzae]